MSRTYSKICYKLALHRNDFAEEYIQHVGFVPTTKEREHALAKKDSAKSIRGRRSAPRIFVQKSINRPYRRECDAMLKKIQSNAVDADNAVFPLPLKTALWNWL